MDLAALFHARARIVATIAFQTMVPSILTSMILGNLLTKTGYVRQVKFLICNVEQSIYSSDGFEFLLANNREKE